MANLEMWAEYHGECPMCGEDVVMSYMPSMGESIICEGCGRDNRVSGISEQCRPAKKEKRRTARLKSVKSKPFGK